MIELHYSELRRYIVIPAGYANNSQSINKLLFFSAGSLSQDLKISKKLTLFLRCNVLDARDHILP